MPGRCHADGMRRWIVPGRVALVAGLLAVAACSSDEASPAKPRTLEERARGLASDLDCEDPRDTHHAGGDSHSVDCSVEGRETTRIIVFETHERPRMERTYAEASRFGAPGTCPDGGPHDRQWFLIGPDWLVLTAEEPIADRLRDRSGTEVLAEGRDLASPVSYKGPDVCSRPD